jgi:hypothetical protein
LKESRSQRLAGLAALFTVFLAFQAYVVWSGKIPRNSDQAVVGLMARHILTGRGHPVFFYGATYDGSLEPHFVAVVFALAGASFATYRLAMALLLDCIVIAIWAVTRRVFGEGAGRAALAYLAVPPFFLLYKGLTSDGAYDAFLLASIAILGLALAADGRGSQGRLGWMTGLGIAVGIGWWVTPLTLMVTAPVLFWLFLWRAPRPLPGEIVLTSAGAILGSSPWWIWNARHGWASLKASELGTAGLHGFAANLITVIWTSIPTLEGGIRSSPDPRKIEETFLASRSLALIALAILLVPPLVGPLRKERRRQLFGLVLVTVVVAASCSGRLNATEPRFLFAYYAVSAALIGLSIAESAGKGWERALRFLALGVLIVIHGVSSLTARDVPVVSNDKEVAGSLDLLRQQLESAGLSRVYANYWTAYRLSFESAERIIATPIPGDDAVRYLPYRSEVDRAPTPGVVLLGERDACFGDYLRENAMPYRRQKVGEFGVYSRLPPAALASLRQGLGLPLPVRAYRVGWNLGLQPESLAADQSQRVRVEVINRGPCVWSQLVHLGYHWWPLDKTAPAVFDGPRGFLPDFLRPGDAVTISIELRAPDRPGRYRLEYDLVHENVVWFSNKGGQTSSVEILVVPSRKS